MAADRQTDRQTCIHTTSANAVTLVWGSLRFAPIIHHTDYRPSRRLYNVSNILSSGEGSELTA